MKDLEFSTFSTRSFERFSQAISQHLLGNDLLVFGDGPDGGREAAYRGDLSLLGSDQKWSGYTVMQAKFLQVSGSAYQDADWLVGQLRAELEKFVEPGSTLDKPDHYILVTNARLSPMPTSKRGKGGQAKIDEVFNEFRDELGLKSWRVWHLDYLNSVLANAPEIRKSHAAWLTSSDVIAALIDEIELRSKDFQETMTRYLSREIRAQQPVRLQQSGHSGETRTMIEDVFVDLPHSQGESSSGSKDAPMLLSDLVGRSRDCLDPTKKISGKFARRPAFGRLLLLGGPGQGKSTITQFLAQIFRAAYLERVAAELISAETKQVVAKTLARASEFCGQASLPARFPFRIDLPSFADFLADADTPNLTKSLLGFIAAQVAAVATSEVDQHDLRAWLRAYPSIIALDGLDEVPASANRADVLNAIDEFWDEVPDADVLMIITSRPQGYGYELDDSYYSNIEMTYLAPEQAISCAERLAIDRIADPIHRERMLARLREAAESPTTARLLISPLQVAIMLSLLGQKGDIPTDRWSLFDKYFNVILEREQNKSGEVGKVMRHWSRHIISLHYSAGFLLHLKAEKEGNSEAYMTSAAFTSLIRNQLADAGYEGQELDECADLLTSYSTERLVLLVQRIETRFIFEVRSLQEFMAAAFIMSGKEAIVGRRLRLIANRAHWLHVFQIAASRCFSIAGAEQYRDTIVLICRELNENGSNIDRFLRFGSKLALSLLDDGLAYDQPNYRRLLLYISLEALERAHSKPPPSITSHCTKDSNAISEKLTPYLRSLIPSRRRAALTLLIACAVDNQDWAIGRLDDEWPEQPREAICLISSYATFQSSTKVLERLDAAMRKLSPNELRDIVIEDQLFDYLPRGDRSRSLPLINLLFKGDVNTVDARLFDAEEALPLAFKYNSIDLHPDYLASLEGAPPSNGWEAFDLVRLFERRQPLSILAEKLVKVLSDDQLPTLYNARYSLPWPLATMVAECMESADPNAVPQKLVAGEYGDYTDWEWAEKRWKSQGIVEEDLTLAADGKFFDASVSEYGFALGNLSLAHRDKAFAWISKLTELALSAKSSPQRWLTGVVQFVLTFHHKTAELTADEMCSLISPVRGLKDKEMVDVECLLALRSDAWQNHRLLDQLSELGSSERLFVPNEKVADGLDISVIRILIDNLGERPGLIVLLAHFVLIARFENLKTELERSRIGDLAEHQNPIIRGYAAVLSLLFNEPSANVVREVLRIQSNRESSFPLFLLHQFMVTPGLLKENIRLLDIVANELTKNPDADGTRPFFQTIEAVANERTSDLDQYECWRDLEFGESLYTNVYCSSD